MFLWFGTSIAQAQPVEIKAFASSVDLSKQWKVQRGDDPAWAKPDFDDSTWRTVDLTEAWGQRKFDQ